MSDLFELLPGSRDTYEVDASHKLGLPGVQCSVCGDTWSAVGVSYPLVDVELLSKVTPELKHPAPISEGRMVELRTIARSEVGATRYLPPGTDFGPLEGASAGSSPPILWANPWTVLLRKDTYDAASRGRHVPLKGKVAKLAGTRFEFLELEATPVDLLGIQVRCTACGRFGAKRDGSKRILGERWPMGEELVRVAELPTVILAKELLARDLKSLDPDGISIAPCDAL